jgi:hypothetical protein
VDNSFCQDFFLNDNKIIIFWWGYSGVLDRKPWPNHPYL